MEKVYWKQRNGQLIDVDSMDVQHLRNTLKMIIRNRVSVPAPKKEVKLHGDIASQHQDLAMLYSISPEFTCSCDEVHQCQQCYEESKN